MIKDNKELKIQLAIGTLPTAPQVLSKIVKVTDSLVLIKWALKHKNGKVRAAAIRNPLCPDLDYIKLVLFDHTSLVSDSHDYITTERINSISKLLSSLETPQLELQLGLDLTGLHENS